MLRSGKLTRKLSAAEGLREQEVLAASLEEAATILAEEHRYEKACVALGRSYAVLCHIHGSDHDSSSRVLERLVHLHCTAAQHYLSLSQPSVATSALHPITSLMDRDPGLFDTLPYLSSLAFSTLAAAARMTGDFPAARFHLDRSARIEAVGAQTSARISSHLNLARVKGSLGHCSDALAQAGMAYKMAEEEIAKMKPSKSLEAKVRADDLWHQRVLAMAERAKHMESLGWSDKAAVAWRAAHGLAVSRFGSEHKLSTQIKEEVDSLPPQPPSKPRSSSVTVSFRPAWKEDEGKKKKEPKEAPERERRRKKKTAATVQLPPIAATMKQRMPATARAYTQVMPTKSQHRSLGSSVPTKLPHMSSSIKLMFAPTPVSLGETEKKKERPVGWDASDVPVPGQSEGQQNKTLDTAREEELLLSAEKMRKDAVEQMPMLSMMDDDLVKHKVKDSGREQIEEEKVSTKRVVKRRKDETGKKEKGERMRKEELDRDYEAGKQLSRMKLTRSNTINQSMSMLLQYKNMQAATSIQTVIRTFVVRRKFLMNLKKRNDAAAKIQAMYRMHVQYEKYKRLKALRTNTATTIQSLWRKARQRVMFVVTMRGLARTQAQWKAYVARKEFCRQRDAIVVVQKKYRHHRVKSFVRQRAAKVVQKNYRFSKKRKVITRQASARIIQQSFRCNIQVQRDRRIRAAASIQSGWRGHLGRKEAHELNKVRSAKRIQSGWRGHLGRKEAHELNKVRSAKRIQKTYRMHRDKKKIRMLQKYALDIQKVWFGHKSRVNTKRYRESMWKQNNAAICIQKSYRRSATRKHLKRERAATVIQKSYRSFAGKKDSKATAAATKIQKTVRGHFGRECYRMTRWSSFVIKAFFLGILARRYVKAVLAARAIQSFWKGRGCRAEIAKKQKAALRIQNWMEKKYKWKKRSQIQAVVVIQALYKQHLVKCRHRRSTAASVIQAAFRGYKVRKLIKIWPKSASLIQKAFRRKFPTAYVHHKATIIQSMYWVWKTRANLQIQHKAALRIQMALLRGMSAKQSMNEYAAILLQSCYRGYIQRAKLKRNRAAIKIQSRFRGQWSRAQYWQYMSAKVIQARWKGYREEKMYNLKKRSARQIQRAFCRRYKEVNAASSKVQAVVKSFNTRRCLRKEREAVLLIQRVWRGSRDRIAAYVLRVQKNERIHNESVAIQRIVRGWLSRKWMKKAGIAVIEIQRVFRGWVERKFVTLKKELRSVDFHTRMFRNLVSRRTIAIYNKAATTIQLAWFRYRARRHIRSDNVVKKLDLVMERAAWFAQVCKEKAFRSRQARRIQRAWVLSLFRRAHSSVFFEAVSRDWDGNIIVKTDLGDVNMDSYSGMWRACYYFALRMEIVRSKGPSIELFRLMSETKFIRRFFHSDAGVQAPTPSLDALRPDGRPKSAGVTSVRRRGTDGLQLQSRISKPPLHAPKQKVEVVDTGVGDDDTETEDSYDYQGPPECALSQPPVPHVAPNLSIRDLQTPASFAERKPGGGAPRVRPGVRMLVQERRNIQTMPSRGRQTTSAGETLRRPVFSRQENWTDRDHGREAVASSSIIFRPYLSRSMYRMSSGGAPYGVERTALWTSASVKPPTRRGSRAGYRGFGSLRVPRNVHVDLTSRILPRAITDKIIAWDDGRAMEEDEFEEPGVIPASVTLEEERVCDVEEVEVPEEKSPMEEIEEIENMTEEDAVKKFGSKEEWIRFVLNSRADLRKRPKTALMTDYLTWKLSRKWISLVRKRGIKKERRQLVPSIACLVGPKFDELANTFEESSKTFQDIARGGSSFRTRKYREVEKTEVAEHPPPIRTASASFRRSFRVQTSKKEEEKGEKENFVSTAHLFLSRQNLGVRPKTVVGLDDAQMKEK